MNEATARRGRRGAAPAVVRDPLLTVPEVMAELRVGRNQVYDLIKSRRLRSVLIGTRRKVRRSWIDEYVADQEKVS